MESHKSHCFLLRNSGSWLARNQVEKNETFVPCGVRGVEVKSSQPDRLKTSLPGVSLPMNSMGSKSLFKSVNATSFSQIKEFKC